MFKGAVCYAILAAGGVGSRFGGSRPKQFADLAGIPVVVRSAMLFEQCAAVDGLVTVMHADYADEWRRMAAYYGIKKALATVVGGPNRQASVRAGVLKAMKLIGAGNAADALIVVHDAARPLAGAKTLVSVLESAHDFSAAIAATPATDSIKIAAGGFVKESPDRSALYIAQTPQAFSASLLADAHENAALRGIEAYDDAGLLEHMGVRVRLVEGGRGNIKITTSEDLMLAAALLAAKE